MNSRTNPKTSIMPKGAHVFVLLLTVSLVSLSCSSTAKIAEPFESSAQNILRAYEDYAMQRSATFDVAAYDFKPDARLINLKLTFTNLSQEEIKIRPRHFEILVLDERKQVIEEKRIEDPGKYLLKLEREYMDNLRDSRTIWDAQSFYTEAERQSASNSSRLNAFSRNIDQNNLPLELKAFREEREQWQKGFLKSSDLDMNETVEGKIIFEKTANAAYYQLKVKIENSEEYAIFNLSMERTSKSDKVSLLR